MWPEFASQSRYSPDAVLFPGGSLQFSKVIAQAQIALIFEKLIKHKI